MKLKVEIGERLLRAIEKLINHNEYLLIENRDYVSTPSETTGEAIRKAFGIDFTKMSTVTESIGDVSVTRPVGFEEEEEDAN